MGRNKCQNSGTRGRHTRRDKNQSKVETGESNCSTARGFGNPSKSVYLDHTIDSSRNKEKGESSSPREERTNNKSNLLLAKYGQNQKSIAKSVIEINITYSI